MTRRIRYAHLIGFTMMAIGTGCTRGAQPVSNAGDSSLVATLERGPCRGRCPQYRVDVYENGKVLFDGRQNVSSTGAQSGTASVGRVRELMRAIATSGFATVDTAFVYGSANCGTYYTDLPVMTLSAKVGLRMKRVQRDPGCQGAPGFLRTLEAQVDSVAGTSRWISGKGDATR